MSIVFTTAVRAACPRCRRVRLLGKVAGLTMCLECYAGECHPQADTERVIRTVRYVPSRNRLPRHVAARSVYPRGGFGRAY